MPTVLRARAERMFIGEGERPVASGSQPVAEQATNGLVIALRAAVSELWMVKAGAIQASCQPHVPTGLVDEMDVLGWLTADALGHPLLHADDTNGVGKRIASQALRVEQKLKEINQTTRKAESREKAAASKKPELHKTVGAATAAGEAARSTHLEKPYDPKLPAVTVGDKRSEGAWYSRAVRVTSAKAAKTAAQLNAAEAQLDAVDFKWQQAQEQYLALPLDDPGDARTASRVECLEAHRLAAMEEFTGCINRATEAQIEAINAKFAQDRHNIMAAAGSTSEEPWEWDECSMPELRVVAEHMLMAVEMAVGLGWADCAPCMYRTVQRAEDIGMDVSERREQQWREKWGMQQICLTPELSAAWRRSKLLGDYDGPLCEDLPRFDGEAWLMAVAQAPRCQRCSGSRKDVLTKAGQAAAEQAAVATAQYLTMESIAHWGQQKKKMAMLSG